MWGYKSGGGSDPEFAQVWIDHVNALLAKEDIKTVIDVGCGDWRIGRHLNLQGKDYTGIEVSSVIFKEIKLNATENIKFINADFETLDIPEVDLILIKDVLQHLPNASVLNIVKKITNKSRYALFCDDVKEYNNNDIRPGQHRFLDLSAAPFNFSFAYVDKLADKVISLYTKEV
jgi:SAM-dependent methyltransferase